LAQSQLRRPITKLADTGTPIPGSTGAFFDLSCPSIDSDRVAFFARDDQSPPVYGVYLANLATGTITTVADTSTEQFVAFTANFQSVAPGLEGSEVSFRATKSDFTSTVLKTVAGVLTTVSDSDTPVPGNLGETFAVQDELTVLHGGLVAFGGDSAKNYVYQSGVYNETAGSLRLVADWFTTPPNLPGDPWRTFAAGWDLHDGYTVFNGSNSPARGLFILPPGGNPDSDMVIVADTFTPRPGAMDNFSFFGRPLFDNGDVLFQATGEGNTDEGIYRYSGGAIVRLYGRGTATPGRPGVTLNQVSGLSADDGSVSFVGFSPDDSGIFTGLYSDFNGSLEKVIETGDELDGRTVTDIRTCGQALSGDKVAFRVQFGSRDNVGLFVADLAAPNVEDTLTNFDDSVSNGTLEGDGKGNSADNRLQALRDMLEAAGDLINAGDTAGACGQLAATLRKTDGASPPPDFVKGPDAATLAAEIAALMDSLNCP
jgi:hypothetical protein